MPPKRKQRIPDSENTDAFQLNDKYSDVSREVKLVSADGVAFMVPKFHVLSARYAP